VGLILMGRIKSGCPIQQLAVASLSSLLMNSWARSYSIGLVLFLGPRHGHSWAPNIKDIQSTVILRRISNRRKPTLDRAILEILLSHVTDKSRPLISMFISIGPSVLGSRLFSEPH